MPRVKQEATILTSLILLLLPSQLKAQPYCVRNMSYTGSIYALVVSGDDDIFVGGSDLSVGRWKLSNPSYQRAYLVPSFTEDFVANETHLFIGQWSDNIILFDVVAAATSKQYPFSSYSLTSIDISGDYLFSSHSDNNIRYWSISNESYLGIFAYHGDFLRHIIINGDYLISFGLNNYQWRISDQSLLRVLPRTGVAYFTAIATGDSVFAAGGGSDGVCDIHQWDVINGDLVKIFSGHADRIYSLAAKGDFLFSGSKDLLIKQWNVNTGLLVRTYVGHNNQVMALAVGRHFLISAAFNRTIKQWLIPELMANNSEATPITTTSRETSSAIITSSLFTASSSPTNTASYSSIPPEAPTETPRPLPVKPSESTIQIVAIAGSFSLVFLVASLLAYQMHKKARSENKGPNNQFSQNPNISNLDDSLGVNAINLSIMHGPNKLAGSFMTLSSTGSSPPLSIGTGGSSAITAFPNISNTTTLFTGKQQGLFVPGHYLLDARCPIYTPLGPIYSNRNCNVVYAQAMDLDLRRRCRNGAIAVKSIKNLNAGFVETFYQEISIMYFFVGKPNIVQLVGFTNNPYQILTDYYALGNLEQALLKQQLIISSVNVIMRISLQISAALAFMHECGFAHADIKALNIFMDRDNQGQLQAYLGDFGIAQVLDDTHLVVKAYRVLNSKGLTVPYASPEVLMRFQQDREATSTTTSPPMQRFQAGDFLRADIYSLGILLYEIVTCSVAWR